MRSKRTLFFIEIAILTAFALTLDLIPFLKFKLWPAGGSISLAMIPIFILAFRWGIKGGILSGFLWGILQIAAGEAYILYIWQGIIEYGFAFASLGLAGVVAAKVQAAVKEKNARDTLTYITLGILIGGLSRFFLHFLAGTLFFGEMAPEGQPVWLYSLIYNGSYMIPSMIICTVVVFYLFHKQPRTVLTSAY